METFKNKDTAVSNVQEGVTSQGEDTHGQGPTQDDQIIREHSYCMRPCTINLAELDTGSKENMTSLEEMVEEALERRKQQCSVLIDFLTGNAKLRRHLEAITTGCLHSLWEGKRERATTYFDDDTQLDEVVSFLFGVLKDTPGARQPPDPVAFVFDVLLPETVIYSLVEVHSLSVQEATELYRQGPQYEPCELDLFQICLQKNMSAEATKRLQDFDMKLRNALQTL